MKYKHIIQLRKEKGITISQLAKQIDIDIHVYESCEKGETMFLSQDLIKLAQFYKTSVDYLLDLTDVKISYPK